MIKGAEKTGALSVHDTEIQQHTSHMTYSQMSMLCATSMLYHVNMTFYVQQVCSVMLCDVICSCIMLCATSMSCHVLFKCYVQQHNMFCATSMRLLHHVKSTWHTHTWGQGDDTAYWLDIRWYSILVGHNMIRGGREMSVWSSRYKGRCALLPTRLLSPCGVYVCESASMCVCLCVTVWREATSRVIVNRA